MIKIVIDNQNRIIRHIINHDDKRLEAIYRGWHISIYPMFGKLVYGQYRSDLETGEFGVDVTGPDGGKIVDAVVDSMDEGIKMALENILLCRTRYGEI